MVKINKPNLAFRGSLTPINKSRIDKIVQHHMAHKSWHIKDVHNFHKNSNGWAGIGYNYWIDFDGNIYEGRGMHVGAHVGGHNSHTIGVGYQGDFTSQKMTDAQLRAGIELNKCLIGQLPNVSKNDIIGHRDLASTTCPGPNFRMSELKSGVGGKGTQPSKPGNSSSKKSISKMADEVIAGKHGSGHANRRKSLGISQSKYEKVRAEVNKRSGKTTKPSKPKKKRANLSVDGKWGKSTTRALQKALGTPVDGIISKQPKNSVSQSLYGNTVQFGSGGSNVIVALQRKIGANADGKLGPGTIRSLQKYLGTTQDGILSRPSLVIKELQRRLNAGTF